MLPLISQRALFKFRDEVSPESKRGHESFVIGLFPLRDGTVISYSLDRLAKRWDVKRRGKLLNTYSCTTGFYFSLDCIKLTEISENAFAIGIHQSVRIWNKHSGQLMTAYSTSSPVTSLLKLKYKPTLLCGTKMGAILEFDLSDSWNTDPQFSHILHTSDVSSLYELPDGTVFSSSTDGTISRWDLDDGDWVGSVEPGMIEFIQLQESQLFASRAADHSIKIWNFFSGSSEGSVVMTLISQNPQRGLYEVQKDTILCYSSEKIQAWNLATKNCTTLCQMPYNITSMTVLLEEGLILIGGVKDGRIEARKACFKLSFFLLSSFSNNRLIDNILILLMQFRPRLIDICCYYVATNPQLYDINKLKSTLPPELSTYCSQFSPIVNDEELMC